MLDKHTHTLIAHRLHQAGAVPGADPRDLAGVPGDHD
ncbi:Uncharacterised protein [Enterobacter cloacae]|uniref:Uncharacterized protein n=1 Tax=Enterobacter cloacae TaxID=550 RepID=A0A377M7Q6_ENTCL|nr:Uncharacterised protein [Enterobacter cloacae]